MEKWYFTFCLDDEKHAGKYVCLEGTCEETRRKMTEMFGTHWAFQYTEEEFNLQLNSHIKLTPLYISDMLEPEHGDTPDEDTPDEDTPYTG